MNIEIAKQMLARRDVDRNMTCYGIPVEEFDKDDLITMLAMLQQEVLGEQKLHEGTLGILRACSRA
jgi:hypothetical protein